MTSISRVFTVGGSRSGPRAETFWRGGAATSVTGASCTGARESSPDLAATLRKLVEAEAQALRAGKNRKQAIYAAHERFYKGDIARTIDAYFRANGGFLGYEDLAAHQGEWVEPVSTNYRGYDVWELPPNSQGIAALQMLNVLEGYDFSKIPFGSPEHVHLLVEAKKLAFADRARWYADPAFQPAPVARLISRMRNA